MSPAPNKQPTPGRPGPKSVNTHAPHTGGNPGSNSQNAAPAGPGDKKGVVTPPTGGHRTTVH